MSKRKMRHGEVIILCYIIAKKAHDHEFVGQNIDQLGKTLGRLIVAHEKHKESAFGSEVATGALTVSPEALRFAFAMFNPKFQVPDKKFKGNATPDVELRLGALESNIGQMFELLKTLAPAAKPAVESLADDAAMTSAAIAASPAPAATRKRR